MSEKILFNEELITRSNIIYIIFVEQTLFYTLLFTVWQNLVPIMRYCENAKSPKNGLFKINKKVSNL